MALDDEHQTQHVVLLAVFELGSADERSLRAHARASLAGWSRGRRRLATVPGVHHPVLVDAPELDLGWHVRFVDLRQGGRDALQKLVTRVYADPLDRRRPLWEQWYVTGAAPNRRIVLTKAHACLFDEQGRLPALTALLRSSADLRVRAPGVASVNHPPAGRQLVRQEWEHYRASLGELGRALGVSGRAWSAPAHVSRTARALGSGVAELFAGAFAGPKREPPRVEGGAAGTDWIALGPAERGFHGPQPGSHQLVLDAVTRALQKAPLAGAAPVLGLSARLGTDGDRRRRPELRVFSVAREGAAGARRGAGPPAFAAAESIANLTFVNLATWAAHLARRRRAFDVLVAEVPAPEAPAYLLDGRLLEFYPLLPRSMNNSLSVAHTRYGEQLFVGVCGTHGGWPRSQDVLRELSSAASPNGG